MVDLSALDAEDISNLSDAQEKILSILPIFPSLLSLLGSAQITYMVLTANRTTPYRRILLGLSCSDILSSIVYPWQAFLVPHETSQRIWAIGNDATCSLIGFTQQLFFMSIWYNGMLSCYFLLTVRFGVKDPVVARRYEPLMHGIAIGYPLITACIGAIMGWFHEVEIGMGCWVKNYPEGCGCNEGKQGVCCQSEKIAWAVGGAPTLLVFFTILINNLLVFCHVRRTIQRGRQHASAQVSMFRKQPTQPQPSSSEHQPRSTSTTTTDPQLARIRAVATQAFLYVGVFLITYVPSIVLRAMEGQNFDAEDEQTLFPLLVVQAFTLPSQGLFNLFVYIRPSYIRARKDYPQESRFWAFRRALYGDRIRPTPTNSRGNNHDSTRVRPSTQFGVGNFFRRSTWHQLRRSTPFVGQAGQVSDHKMGHSQAPTITAISGLKASGIGGGCFSSFSRHEDDEEVAEVAEENDASDEEEDVDSSPMPDPKQEFCAATTTEARDGQTSTTITERQQEEQPVDMQIHTHHEIVEPPVDHVDKDKHDDEEF